MLAKRECRLGGDVGYAAKTLVMLASLGFALMQARADDYPSRRATLIAPCPPPAAIATLCGELALAAAELLGQPVVVENRPGAGSTIGTADAARASPDGYTIVMAGSGSLAISPTLYKQ